MKTVIVTGVSRGIGAAIVRSLRTKNIKVIGIARSEQAVKALAAEKIGPGPMVPIVGDIRNEETLSEAVKLSVEADSNLVGLILNAATGDPFGRVAEVDIDDWKSTFEINVFAQTRLVQLALPHLRRSKGRIVFVSTGLAEIPCGGWSSYCW
jgi:NAD(P)-dependent dehydrogenase (short-subunit alcohol dehydrogenase family)